MLYLCLLILFFLIPRWKLKEIVCLNAARRRSGLDLYWLNIALLAKLVLVGKTCAARLTEREAE